MLLLKKSQFWLQGRHLHSVPKSGFFDCPHRNSLGYLLRMQSPGISCRPTVSKALRVGPQESVLKSTLHVFLMHIKVGEPLAFLSFCINWHLPVCGWYSVPVDLTGTEMCKPGTRPVLIPCAIWRCGLHTLEMLYPVISMSTPLSLYHPWTYLFLGLLFFPRPPWAITHLSWFLYNSSDDFWLPFTSPDSFPELQPHLYNNLSSTCIWMSHGPLKSTWLNGALEPPWTPVLSPLLELMVLPFIHLQPQTLSFHFTSIHEQTLLIRAVKYTWVNYISIKLEKI